MLHSSAGGKVARAAASPKVVQNRLLRKMTEVVQGYAHLWFSTASTRRFSIAPHAFSSWLRSYGNSIKLLFEHHPGLAMAKHSDNTLRMWSDDIGLAFEAIVQGRHVYMFIDPLLRGELGCSIDAKFLKSRLGLLAGVNAAALGSKARLFAQPMGQVVEKASISEITLTRQPAFADTGCWLAAADQLPAGLEALRQAWHEHAPRARLDPWPRSELEIAEAREAAAEAARKPSRPRDIALESTRAGAAGIPRRCAPPPPRMVIR